MVSDRGPGPSLADKEFLSKHYPATPESSILNNQYAGVHTQGPVVNNKYTGIHSGQKHKGLLFPTGVLVSAWLLNNLKQTLPNQT